MNDIQHIEQKSLQDFQTLAFAGGGNRCWWQAGLVNYLFSQGWNLPSQIVGTSAGAAIAASCINGNSLLALEACLKLYRENAHIVNRPDLRRFRLCFAHEYIYPAWIRSFFGACEFKGVLSSSISLQIALTRPARFLGLHASVLAGTVAYLADKYIYSSIHPRLPRYFGLVQEFVSINTCTDAQDAQLLLIAAAAAPPFMPSQKIGSFAALDGGFTDNAPIYAQTDAEKDQTLVLLTRHYPNLPTMFRWRRRVYLQPSRKVPVSTWDCTPKATVLDAFNLGQQDAVARLKSNEIVI
jgi:predicted acylesterase/phospholipase RssA